jgi:hypothetical protein
MDLPAVHRERAGLLDSEWEWQQVKVWPELRVVECRQAPRVGPPRPVLVRGMPRIQATRQGSPAAVAQTDVAARRQEALEQV